MPLPSANCGALPCSWKEVRFPMASHRRTAEPPGPVKGARVVVLSAAARSLRQDRAAADARLAELDRTRTVLAARKRTVQRRLGEARGLLGSLAPGQRAAIGLGPTDAARVDSTGPVPHLPALAPPSV